MLEEEKLLEESRAIFLQMGPLFAPVSSQGTVHQILHEGSQKVTSSLSRDVRSVLIIDTVSGEILCLPTSITSRKPEDSQ